MTVEKLRALLIGAADAQAEVRIIGRVITGVKHSHKRGQKDVVTITTRKK